MSAPRCSLIPTWSSINGISHVDLETDFEIFLDIDALQPFDVVLSYGMTKGSKLMTMLSEPPYSHASLVVAPKLMFFEADDEGLLPTFLGRRRIEVMPDGTERNLLILDQYRKIGVFRLPELVNYPAWPKLLDLFYMLLEEVHGQPYPAFYSLAPASSIPEFYLKPFVAIACRLARGGKDVRDGRGFFCSALVTAAYQQLGFKLFDEDRLPQTVSPSSLGRSRLAPIENALRIGNTEAILDQESARWYNLAELINRGDISRQQLYHIGRQYIRKAEYDTLYARWRDDDV